MKAADFAVTIVESENDEGTITTCLKIHNIGEDIVGNNWRLYFSLGLTPLAGETRVRQMLIDGRYGYLEPGDDWDDLRPGSSISVSVENWLFSGMPLCAEQGFHLTEFKAGSNEELLLGAPTLPEPELIPLKRLRNEWIRGLSPSADVDPQTPEYLFEKNNAARDGGDGLTIVPAVKQWHTTGDPIACSGFRLDDNTVEGIDISHLPDQPGFLSADGIPINLDLDQRLDPDSYELITSSDRVTVSGGSRSAIYHGLHTFRQLLETSDDDWSLPAVSIADRPDFPHRAFYLDIARHFQSAEQIKKTIVAMAAYKMNRLQLGISNDEGWRLEINSMPELTEVGGRRSFYTAGKHGEVRALVPAWGDNHEDYSWFLTQAEFVDILEYAAKHHVEVIVELNLPGHANAIIKSMQASGRFQVVDQNDQSTHRSAQGYTNNVVNVALPETYEFVAVVLKELEALYDKASVSFHRIHFGGDETPFGAWLRSPACREAAVWDQSWDVDKEEDATAATHALMAHHAREITRVAKAISPGIEIGFWHEMSRHLSSGRCYFNGWTTEAGDRNVIDDILDRNQSLVISNASFLYLDMPYGLHAEEPGLPWAAYIDTEMIYKFDPLNTWAISNDKASQVKGLQAQLWGETVYSPELMDFYTFPRLLAVAERCWNKTPDMDNWQGFAGALGKRELSYLDALGIAFRVPPPGAKIIDGQVHANVVFPGLAIRYTTDGSDPDADSVLYTEPVLAPGGTQFKFATFINGRSSRIVSVAA